MHRHIIVSGDDALATTIADELKNAGATVVRLVNTEAPRPGSLASSPSLRSLTRSRSSVPEMTTRQTSKSRCWQGKPTRTCAWWRGWPTTCCAKRWPTTTGPVRSSTSPISRRRWSSKPAWRSTTHRFEAAGIEFVVSGTEASRDATLRELYGDLAPVAVIHGEDSPTPGEVEVCPGRDQRVHAGDWTMMIGTADELAAQGIRIPPLDADALAPAVAAASGRRRSRPCANDVNPTFYPVRGRHVGRAGQLHDHVAVRLPAPAPDGLDRRVLLHHRDDDHDRLRRLQLRAPADLAAAVRHHVDVQPA